MNRGVYFVIAGIALTGFAVAFTLGVSLLGTPATTPAEPDGPVVTRTPIQPAPDPAPEPAQLDVDTPSDREIATTDAYAALATAAGIGRVLCELPAPLPAQEARLRGLEWQNRFADRVYALVPEPTGATSIGGDDPSNPQYVAHWTDAVPGEPGVCHVEKRRILEHRVTLQEPRAEVAQHDCHDVLREEPGTLIVRSIAHLPCTVTIQHDGDLGRTVFEHDQPMNDLVLALDADPTAPPHGLNRPTVAITADHLAAARDAEGLSPEARLLLKRWSPTAP